MKKFLLLSLVFVFTLGLAYAQDDVENIGLVEIKGTIIDNKCAMAHQTDLAEFIKTHTKECALLPDCQESGYSIYSDGKLMSFDEASSGLIAEFLKEEGSRLDVEVEAQKTDYTSALTLIKIKNQE